MLFIGANINSFKEGNTFSINSDKCAQFDQNCPCNLISLMRTASDQITEYKCAKTEGIEDGILSMALQTSKSKPIHHKNFYGEFSIRNFPIPTLIRS